MATAFANRPPWRSAALAARSIVGDAARVASKSDPAPLRMGRAISPVAIAAVCDALTALYEVDDAECRRDVLDLLEDLRAADLITVDDGPQRREP